jgi:hypothetical protein
MNNLALKMFSLDHFAFVARRRVGRMREPSEFYELALEDLMVWCTLRKFATLQSSTSTNKSDPNVSYHIDCVVPGNFQDMAVLFWQRSREICFSDAPLPSFLPGGLVFSVFAMHRKCYWQRPHHGSTAQVSACSGTVEINAIAAQRRAVGFIVLPFHSHISGKILLRQPTYR